jgi:hypothetical protein
MSQRFNEELRAQVAMCTGRGGTVQASLQEPLNSERTIRMYIVNMDFVLLKEKMRLEEGWSSEQIDQVEKRYKKYLFLRWKFQEELMPPPEDIDTFWHYHILDTIAYFKDTAAIFGWYFHHYPYFGMRGDADNTKLHEAFENTKKRWKEEYDEDLGSDKPKL